MKSIMELFGAGGRSSGKGYAPVLQLQRDLAALRKTDDIPDTLLLLQHSPVYTVGKRGTNEHFRVPREDLRQQGFAIHDIDRGGEVTYHGPGQIILYPIVHLRSLRLGARLYVEHLENVMIRTTGAYGLSSRGQVPGRTGVWIGDRKIGAVGVRISNGVSLHGISLNVNTDLSCYDAIIPCGQVDKAVTSLENELHQEMDASCIAEQMMDLFADQLQYTHVEEVSDASDSLKLRSLLNPKE